VFPAKPLINIYALSWPKELPFSKILDLPENTLQLQNKQAYYTIHVLLTCKNLSMGPGSLGTFYLFSINLDKTSCVCVCGCVSERERERGRVGTYVCERERETVCACVCIKERERLCVCL
jgi:hypothetical protein